MATLITKTATSLTAWVYSQSPNVLTPANMAALKAGIRDDLDQTVLSSGLPGNQSPWPMIDYNGLLTIPRRGQIKLYPGDVIAFDGAVGGTGFPVVVSAAAIAANANWTYS